MLSGLFIPTPPPAQCARIGDAQAVAAAAQTAHHGLPPGASPGFSLIELLIVIAVIGTLAGIAYPAYTDSIRKARRTEAFTALAILQQAQERHRANHAAYADSLAALPAPRPVSPTSPGGHYTLTVSGASATAYTATATAVGSQAADLECTALSVTISRGTITQGHNGSAATSRVCWRQ